MLQSSEYAYNGKSNPPAPTPNTNNPVKTVTAPIEQATIGRSLIIKGEISGTEALYIDGRRNRVTIGRNGSVQADISARDVVVMGKVTGNIECSDRVDVRNEGVVNGNISTVRVSVEDGAVLKGGIEVKSEVKSGDRKQNQPHAKAEQQPKALAATAGA
jgi:cytoskeletal protein CcmA (bactofilin family)